MMKEKKKTSIPYQGKIFFKNKDEIKAFLDKWKLRGFVCNWSVSQMHALWLHTSVYMCLCTHMYVYMYIHMCTFYICIYVNTLTAMDWFAFHISV